MRKYISDLPWYDEPLMFSMVDWLRDNQARMNDLMYYPAECGGQVHTTFMHGDYRFDNFFFRETNGEMLLFDFQLSRECCPEMDLAWFIYASPGKDSACITSEAKLIKHYYTELKFKLGPDRAADYTLEECVLMYVLCLSQVGLLMTLGHATMDTAHRKGGRSIELYRGMFESMVTLWKRWDCMNVAEGIVSHGLARRKAAQAKDPESKGGVLTPAEARGLFAKLVSKENRERMGLTENRERRLTEL